MVAALPVQITTVASRPQLIASVAEAGCIKLSVPILSTGRDGCPAGTVSDDPANGGPIVAYLKMILQLLSMGVGVVVILMLVIAGIQYITSVGDPANIKKAKERITNAITAMMLFIFAYAILSFLIPGGIF